MEPVRFLFQPNNQFVYTPGKHYQLDELTIDELPWLGEPLVPHGYVFSDVPMILNDSWTLNLRSDMEDALLSTRTPVITYNNVKYPPALTNPNIYEDKIDLWIDLKKDLGKRTPAFVWNGTKYSNEEFYIDSKGHICMNKKN